MNFENILSEIEKVDPEVYDRLDTRRHAMQRFRRIGSRIALTAVPFAIGAMFKKAYGQPSTSAAKDILKYALTLEYLEAAFYTRGVNNATTIGVPAGAATTAITKLQNDENAHVAFLKNVITTAFSGTAADVASPNIDLTGGKSAAGTGPFAGAYQAGGYAVYLAIAQTFEDTGVRAYKGRAKELTKGGDYLQAALQIHSVEARHASHIRQMRAALNMAIPSGQTVKPWITQSQTGITPTGNSTADGAITAAYNGATPESNATQAGVPITNIAGQAISADAATQAFDEPLTVAEVLAIVNPFFY
jgi:hypothetical protein